MSDLPLNFWEAVTVSSQAGEYCTLQVGTNSWQESNLVIAGNYDKKETTRHAIWLGPRTWYLIFTQLPHTSCQLWWGKRALLAGRGHLQGPGGTERRLTNLKSPAPHVPSLPQLLHMGKLHDRRAVWPQASHWPYPSSKLSSTTDQQLPFHLLVPLRGHNEVTEKVHPNKATARHKCCVCMTFPRGTEGPHMKFWCFILNIWSYWSLFVHVQKRKRGREKEGEGGRIWGNLRMVEGAPLSRVIRKAISHNTILKLK